MWGPLFPGRRPTAAGVFHQDKFNARREEAQMQEDEEERGRYVLSPFSLLHLPREGSRV